MLTKSVVFKPKQKQSKPQSFYSGDQEVDDGCNHPFHMKEYSEEICAMFGHLVVQDGEVDGDATGEEGVESLDSEEE